MTVEPQPKAIGDGSKVELGFAIHEGPQILIDHVLIVGNQRTSRETILREVQLKSGQPLSQQQEDETRTRITALGLFRRVDISYLQLPGEQNHRDVVITVEEAPVTTIGYGGGLEGGRRLVRSVGDRRRRRGVSGRAARVLSGRPAKPVRQGPIARPVHARQLSAEGRQRLEAGGTPRSGRAGRTGIRIQRISRAADVSASGAFSAPMPTSRSAPASSRGSGRASTSSARGGSATLTRRISRTIAVSGRYGIDQTRLLNIKSNFAAQPEIDRLFPAGALSSVSSSLIRDTRNDSLEPTSRKPDRHRRRAGGQGASDRRSGFSRRSCRDSPIGSCADRSSAGPRPRGARRAGTGFPRTVTSDGADHRRRHCPRASGSYAGGDTTVRGFTLDRLGTPETDRPGRLPDGRSWADRAERRAAHSGARRSWRGRVHRWRQRLAPGIATWNSLRRCAAPSASACAIVRRWGRFASTWASSSIADRCCRRASSSGRRRCTSSWDRRSDGTDADSGREQRAESRGQNARRVLVVAFALCSLLSALSASASEREIIDRVLAILPGQIITLSDVEAALDLGLVEAPAGGDRIAGGLSALIDRVLMLNEVRRVAPPEPSPAAIDARVARIRAAVRLAGSVVAPACGQRLGRNGPQAVRRRRSAARVVSRRAVLAPQRNRPTRKSGKPANRRASA